MFHVYSFLLICFCKFSFSYAVKSFIYFLGYMEFIKYYFSGGIFFYTLYERIPHIHYSDGDLYTLFFAKLSKELIHSLFFSLITNPNYPCINISYYCQIFMAFFMSYFINPNSSWINFL